MHFRKADFNVVSVAFGFMSPMRRIQDLFYDDCDN